MLNLNHTLYLLGLFQILLFGFLSVCTTLEIAIQLSIFTSVFILSVPLLRTLKTPGLMEHFWSTYCFGGVGMLLGHQLDNFLTLKTDHMNHHAHAIIQVGDTGLISINQIITLMFSGMTLVMLACCIPACLLLCNHHLNHCSNHIKGVLHGGSSAFMVIGMLFASLTSNLLMFDAGGNIVVNHYYMLVLMTVFSATAYYIISRLIHSFFIISSPNLSEI